MKLLNNSSRLHVIGGVMIVPGQIAEVPETFRNAYNKQDLVEVTGEPVEAEAEPAPKSTKAGNKNGKADDDAA